jgi:outer membrane receptor protein involved in Fe transport
MGVVMNLPRFGALCIIACVLSVEAANANPAAEQIAAGTVSNEAQSRGSTSEEVTPGQLEEVIVTAQKRSERIQDVPMSITAVSRDELSKEGVFSPADLEKVAPGFTYRQSQNGTPVYAIRGIGFYSEQAAVAPTVTIYQDQTPLPYARMAEGVGMDVERVEVLKGPQGTLFGQNSTAGAVNYIAAKPTNTMEAGVDATYGRFNEFDMDAFVSGPIGKGVKARLSFREELRDGWQLNSIIPGQSIGRHDLSIGRLLLESEPIDSLTINLNFNGWADRSDTQQSQARGYLPVSGLPPHTPQTIATATALINYPYVRSDNSRLTDWNPGTDYSRHDDFYQVAANIKYAISSDIDLISITSYANLGLFSPIDSTGTYVPALTVDQHGKIKTFSQELRLEGNALPVHWVLGANYERDNTDEVQYTFIRGSNTQVPFGNPFDPSTQYGTFNSDDLYNNQQVHSYAGFANLDYKWTDKLSVQGGLRYTKENRDFSGCVADDIIGAGFGLLFVGPNVVRGSCVTVLPDGSHGLYSSSLDQNNLSWRGSINYKVTSDALVYVNVTKGFKSGDFGTLPALSYKQFQPVRQESVLAYETGFKSTLADRKVDLSGALFYYDYRDKQTQGSIVVPPFGNLPYLVNVPKSRLMGAEFAVTLIPVTGLRMTMGGTYIDSKIIAPAPVASPYGDLIDANGEELPVSPKWQIQEDTEYDWSIRRGLDAFVGGNVSGRSKSVAALGSRTGPIGTQSQFDIDGYVLLDLRAGVNINEKYRVQIWGKNVTNKGYWNNVVHIYDTYDRITGQPVTYGITFSAKF